MKGVECLAQGGLGTNYKACFKFKNLPHSNFSWWCSCPFGFAHCKGLTCWKSYSKSSNDVNEGFLGILQLDVSQSNKDWTHLSPFCSLEIKMPFSDIQHFSWNESQSLRLKLRSDQATNSRIAWGEMSTKREGSTLSHRAPLLHKSGQEALNEQLVI